MKISHAALRSPSAIRTLTSFASMPATASAQSAVAAIAIANARRGNAPATSPARLRSCATATPANNNAASAWPHRISVGSI